MTNEEAIKELQSMCDHLHAHGICDKDSKMLTACKMAISALEQMPEVTSTMQTGQFDYVRQPCEDAVSREDALKSLIENTDFEGWELSQALEAIEKLPSVTQKTGRWIEHPEIETSAPEYLMFYECSECGDRQCFCKSDIHKKRFCGNCGCRMVEPQESEKV